MIISIIALNLASAALVISVAVVSRSRRDAGNCARDARLAAKAAANAAEAAREAARSVAQVDLPDARVHIENMQIQHEPGAMAPTIPIDARRVAREMREFRDRSWAEHQRRAPKSSPVCGRENATPDAGADSPAPGVVTKP